MMRTRLVLLAGALFAGNAAAQRVAEDMREPVLVMSGGDSLFVVPSAKRVDFVRDVQPIKDGGIAVLTQRSLRTYSANGKPGTVIDGITDGVSMQIDRLSQITVRDDGAHQWKTFDLSGKLLSSRPFPSQLNSYMRWPMRGGATLIETAPRLQNLVPPGWRDTVFTRTVSVQIGSAPPTPLFAIRADSVYFKSGKDTTGFESRAQRTGSEMFALTSSRFGASGAWAICSDSVAVFIDGLSGGVTWYSIGSGGAAIAAQARIARSARLVDANDVADEKARLQRLAVASAPARYQDSMRISKPAIIATPGFWSVATRALVADDGALWVGVNRIYTDSDPKGEYLVRIGDDNTWTVFPQTGPAYTITLRARFRLTAIRGGKLYGFVDSGIGDPEIEIYRVAGESK